MIVDANNFLKINWHWTDVTVIPYLLPTSYIIRISVQISIDSFRFDCIITNSTLFILIIRDSMFRKSFRIFISFAECQIYATMETNWWQFLSIYKNELFFYVKILFSRNELCTIIIYYVWCFFVLFQYLAFVPCETIPTGTISKQKKIVILRTIHLPL